MSKPHSIVIVLGGQEYLSLVPKPPERLRMKDTIPIPLEGGPERVRIFGGFPALRQRRQSGVGRQPTFLRIFYMLAYRHVFSVMTGGDT